ncbi:MAG: hypothetical protein ABEK50_19040, partial [bacterium]
MIEMTSFGSDKTKPLREVLTEEQINYIKEESDHENIDSILDSSLNEIMESTSKPDLTQLMGQATDSLGGDS